MRRFGDARGWFAETWSAPRFSEWGLDCAFVQDNQSYSAQAGTVRGLHFQRPPHAQAKLVRVLRGAILDHVIDLRGGSPTYGQALSVELSAEGGEQLFVPVGFGHGFVTLRPDTEVAYKVSDVYAPQTEGGVAWDDPDLGLAWPLGADVAPVVSERDRAWPRLKALAPPFAHDGAPLALRRVG